MRQATVASLPAKRRVRTRNESPSFVVESFVKRCLPPSAAGVVHNDEATVPSSRVSHFWEVEVVLSYLAFRQKGRQTRRRERRWVGLHLDRVRATTTIARPPPVLPEVADYGDGTGTHIRHTQLVCKLARQSCDPRRYRQPASSLAKKGGRRHARRVDRDPERSDLQGGWSGVQGSHDAGHIPSLVGLIATTHDGFVAIRALHVLAAQGRLAPTTVDRLSRLAPDGGSVVVGPSRPPVYPRICCWISARLRWCGYSGPTRSG